MKKAIAIITYARAHYFSLVLPSILAQRIGGKPVSEVYDIYIFQDGLWAEETSDNRSGHAIIDAMLETRPDKDRVFQQDANLGVALHFDFIEKLLFAAGGYDFVAFCEDDLILAPGYMATLDEMAVRFADDPRVGMMSAHPGVCTVPLHVQREHLRDFAGMGHNWGFGLTRNFWKRRQPFVERYLDLIRDVPYRRRDTPRIFDWLQQAGFRADASSQDYIKTCATTALGACRLSSFANLGLPIGITGLHCTPEVFSLLGLDHAVVVDQEPKVGPLSDDQFAVVYAKSSDQEEDPATRVARLAKLAAAAPQANSVAKDPLARATELEPNLIDAMSPILALVSSRLTKNPEWALPLLELVAGRLTLPMLRSARDSSTDKSVAMRAALNIAGNEGAEVDDWIILAHRLATEGRLIEALNWMNHVLPHQPHVASHHRLKASILERLDLSKEALAAVACALEIEPDNADLLIDQERISIRHAQSLRVVRDANASRPAAAIDAALTLAQGAQTLVEDWTALARLLANSQRLNEALGWASRVLQARPEVAENHCLYMSLLERLGRLQEAMHAAEQAAKLHPHDAVVATDYNRIESAYLTSLFECRDGGQDPAEAVAAGRQLAERQAQNIEHWLALAQLFVRQERDAEALIWMDKLIERRPDVADYLELRAGALERMGRFEEALDDIGLARDLRPKDTRLVQAAGRVETALLRTLRTRRDRSQDLPLAIDAAHKLAQRSTALIDDWVALAHLLAKAERLNEALGWASRALQGAPGAVDLHRLYASLLERLYRNDEALCAINCAMKLHPNEHAIAEDRRRIESKYLQSLRQRRDSSADAGTAIEAAQRLAEHDPATVGDWMALAQLLAGCGRLNEALGWVDRALVIDPVAVHLHGFRVTLLEQLGYFRQGYRAAKLAHTLDPDNDDLPRHAKRLLLKAVADSVGIYRASRTG
jgi:tetratricopeptide (TPR) repeat protein